MIFCPIKQRKERRRKKRKKDCPSVLAERERSEENFFF
jgi:hypothetical protein